tara:strand:+ start:2641 stop:2874 length:234 start_codon:yes stop_codon:yes gene_type:complete
MTFRDMTFGAASGSLAGLDGTEPLALLLSLLYRRATMLVQYELTDLPTLGWLTDCECGEENFYFTTADGIRGFIKCF